MPPILLALAKHPKVADYDLSSLWRVASGAASLPSEIANAVGARLGIRCTDGKLERRNKDEILRVFYT